MGSSLFWDFTQCRLVVSYGRLGQSISLIFKVKAVKDYFNLEPTLPKIQEERRSHLHRGGSLKSRIQK